MFFAYAFVAAAATLSPADHAFVEQALTGNTSEYRQGQIFGDSTDPVVQTFAKDMLTFSGEANTQLIALADSKGMRVSGQSPDAPYPQSTHAPDLSAQQKAKIEDGLPPVAFFAQQVRVYRQSVTLYEREIADGKDTQVVAYAKAFLPKMKQQLRLAQQDLTDERGNHHG